MTREELIAKLATVQEGSRELDEQIAFYTQYPFSGWLSFHEHEAKHDYETAFIAHGPWRLERIPHFTTSLDAALTLAPDGWAWSVTCDPGDEDGTYQAAVGSGPDVSRANTAILAFCIAALIKARGMK